jgi:hypothetical protein
MNSFPVIFTTRLPPASLARTRKLTALPWMPNKRSLPTAARCV